MILRINVNKGITDDEIRLALSNHKFNGEYATQICKNCGSFAATENGDWKTAIILDKCDQCHRIV